MKTNVATHADPVWRSKSNFIIQASLAEFGMPGRWEQLWARRLRESDDVFEICCLPFFTYGIALGDVVRTEVDREFEYVVSSVEEKRGHRTLRAAVVRKEDVPRLHTAIHSELMGRRALHEWNAPGYVAIDIETKEAEARLIEFFDPFVRQGEISVEID